MKQLLRYIYLEYMELLGVIDPYLKSIPLQKTDDNNNCYKAITPKSYLSDSIHIDVIQLKINESLNTSTLSLENSSKSDYLYTKFLYLTNNTDITVKFNYQSNTIYIESKNTSLHDYNQLLKHVNYKLFIK